jgi:ABC-2 type transport system permease protein
VSALLAAEFLKLRTTRAVIVYLAVLVLLSGIGAAAQAGAGEGFELNDPSFQRDLVSTSVAAPLIALLLGIMSVTIEWRHGTITRTFLVTPRRERVLGAKMVAAFLLGVALAVVAVATVLIVAIPVLSGDGASLQMDVALAARIGRIVLGTALWGALGAGVGTLVQNQTVALVGTIIWVILIENLIDALLDLGDFERVADALPGRALGALDGSHSGGALSPAVSGAVGLVYVAVFAALALLRISRQDIT